MAEPTKWCYSVNYDECYGPYESREEAIDEAIREARISQAWIFEDPVVRIGKCEYYNPWIDVDDFLEYVTDIAFNSPWGDYCDGWLRGVPTNDKEELEEQINEVFYNWLKKTNNLPRFFISSHPMEEIEVDFDDIEYGGRSHWHLVRPDGSKLTYDELQARLDEDEQFKPFSSLLTMAFFDLESGRDVLMNDSHDAFDELRKEVKVVLDD